MLYLNKMSDGMLIKIKLKEQDQMIVVNSIFYAVGYQSKFQTAGNLIFKPEENSTLHVSCNSY